MFVCLFFQKGYDESEHSTFSAANYKNNGQTVFLSVWFLLNYCHLATEMQYLRKRERLKNDCIFMHLTAGRSVSIDYD